MKHTLTLLSALLMALPQTAKLGRVVTVEENIALSKQWTREES